MSSVYDAVIIGAGPAGATAAALLAAAGWSVAVVERAQRTVRERAAKTRLARQAATRRTKA